MEKGIWTGYFPEMPPEEAVALLARHGWRRLDLSTHHSEALAWRGRPDAVGGQFRRFCDDLGVELPQAHLDLRVDIARADRAARRQDIEELKRWLELYAVLGVRAAVLHPGGRDCCDPVPLSAELFEANRESLAELASHAARGPTVICLENGPSAGELLRLVQAAGPEELGICLDTGHLGFMRRLAGSAAQSEYDFIREAGRFLKAVHVDDNDGSGDRHFFPFDGGSVDWAGVMHGLRDVGYDGLFGLEVPGETNCSVQERLAKLELASRFVDALMGQAGA